MTQDVVSTAAIIRRDRVLRSTRFVLLTVFLAGVGTLGIEMIAARLLAPYFGASQPIWAVVIGLTLIYLSVGYHLGGRLADRRPDEALLYRVVLWAGFLTGLIPLLADPILRFSQGTIARVAIGSFAGALAGVLLLFAAPVILMAMVSPFAIRLQLKRADTCVTNAGSVAGSLAALSTVGSIIGTFLPVLLLIPTIGTARTTYLVAALLMAIGLVGLRDWRFLLMPLLIAGVAFYTLSLRLPIKAADCPNCTLLAERESAYNYIQVSSLEHPYYGLQINLMLNEGLAVHSIYHPRYEQSGNPFDLLTGGGPWDYFAVGPYFVLDRDPSTVESLAMLGSGTGTVPSQFLAIYGPNTRIDAVEIDPAITALGRQYFALRDASVDPTHPNYRVHTADARYWLATTDQRYDVIGLDAYQQPYIPFHLTTVEFFQQVKDHLATNGVVVVNAGKPEDDDRLGQALASTMRAVFPQVFIIETASGGNQILVGVRDPVGDGVRNFVQNYTLMDVPVLRAVMEAALAEGSAPVREFRPEDAQIAPFTDDRAPVEQLVDKLIFDFSIGEHAHSHE